MMRALGIAATGMEAQQTNVEVIANNIANVSTTGFKRSMAEFQDLLYNRRIVSALHRRKPERSCQRACRSAWESAPPA